MATKKKGFRRGRGFTLPLAIVAGFLPMALDTFKYSKTTTSDGWNQGVRYLVESTTGYDPQANYWSWSLMRPMLPILAGLITHKLIGGKLGVNRMLGQARVPFIRI